MAGAFFVGGSSFRRLPHPHPPHDERPGLPWSRCAPCGRTDAAKDRTVPRTMMARPGVDGQVGTGRINAVSGGRKPYNRAMTSESDSVRDRRSIHFGQFEELRRREVADGQSDVVGRGKSWSLSSTRWRDSGQIALLVTAAQLRSAPRRRPLDGLPSSFNGTELPRAASPPAGPARAPIQPTGAARAARSSGRPRGN